MQEFGRDRVIGRAGCLLFTVYVLTCEGVLIFGRRGVIVLAVAGVLFSGTIAATPDQVADEKALDEPPADQRGLDDLVADLQQLLELFQPRIEDLEARDELLSKQEIDELSQATDVLLSTSRAVKGALAPQDTPPSEIKRADELLARMNALARETQGFSPEPEEPRNAPLMNVLRSYTFYGSVRARLRFRDGESTQADTNTSRVGFRSYLPIGEKYALISRVEAGFRLSDPVDLAGDPGAREFFEGGDVSLRLASVGIEMPVGRFSFGKQWGAYYDVAVFTDQLPYLCCEGHVVFNAGTDGGVSGTGRADWALQYRQSIGNFKFTLQGQFRTNSPVSTRFADTYGASLVYRWNEVLDLGVSYNRVLDGIAMPALGQPKEGDEAAIVGIRYQKDRLYVATTYSRFNQHEFDDLGRFFDGDGAMFIVYFYLIPDRLAIAAEWDDVNPDSSHPGQYRIRFTTIGASYALRKYWEFFLLYRFEDGRLSDGSSRGNDTLMLSAHFNF
jgi:predicted porin